MKISFFIWLFLIISTSVFSADQTTILFIGDSLTEGYGVDKKNSYPALIEKQLLSEGKKVKVMNGSVSGSTTSSGKKRLRWFLKGKPKFLILALGANDGLRGIKLDVSKKNLDEIIALANKNKIHVLLAGMMLPPNYGPDYTKKFKSMYSTLAKKHKLTLIPFLLEGVASIKELNQADGIHPNEKGHVIMKDTVLKYLRPLL